MAKLSRRAADSSSSNSAAITSSPSAQSFSSSPTPATSALSSATSLSNQQPASSEGRRNAEKIVHERKATRSIPAGSLHFIDTPLGGYASASATATATPYPLYDDGLQFKTTHSNVYAYSTTTG